MRSTLMNDEPLMQVSDRPFSPPAFEDYLWFRAEVAIRIQDGIRDTEIAGQVEEVSVFEEIGKS